ncbi:hypothetical protein [Streptomyces sp. NPDC127118]|uniref:hypothetical protein n=1 Tax=Streptomyces sp. NPDC127118 TaxID=3345369 RepID=UPI00363A62CC
MVIEEHEDSALYVNVTNGLYAVTARLGYDAFFELIDADSPEGEVLYITGGQSMKIPSRQLNSPDAAVAAVRHYLITGSIDMGTNAWEAQ